MWASLPSKPRSVRRTRVGITASRFWPLRQTRARMAPDMPHPYLLNAGVLLVGFVACGFDLRTRRIPNALTFGAALLGLVFHAVIGGVSGFGSSLGGLATGLAIFFPIFALGGLGGGDVKLLACIGAWVGADG